MAFKSNIDSQLRGFWFASNGLDTNSGETIEVPKLTIQAAIDAAAALVPPPSFNFSGFVTASQGGEFFDPFVMVESVSLDGNNCNLIVDAPVAVTMASSGLFNMTAISNSQASGICVKVEDNTIRGIDLLFMGVSGDSGIGMEISGTVSDLFSSTRLITLSGENSTGYDITSTSANPIDIDVKVANLTADGTTFISYNPVTTTDATNVNVSTVEAESSMVTGTAFKVDNGTLVVRAGVCNTPTFAVLNNAGQLTIRAQTLVGLFQLNDESVGTVKSVAFYFGDIEINDTATLFMDAQVHFGNLTTGATTNAIVKTGFQTGDVVNNGVLFYEAESLEGDITVASGATFNCDIASHTGSLTNLGTINGVINGVRYGNWIERPVSSVIFVHENGDDSNSGLVPDTPLQTIGAAITLAGTMLPTAINRVLIEITDNGVYAETFELPSFVSLIGENAAVDGRITVLDSTVLQLQRAENSNSSQPVIRKTSGTGFSGIKLTSLVVVGGSQEGVLCSSGMIDFTSDFVEVDAGTGLKSKLGAEILFSVGQVMLTNSGLGLGTRTSDGGANKLVGFVRDATDDGTGVLIETKVPGDVVNIQGGTFNVGTLFDIGATGTLNAFANEANGARIAHATAIVNITNHNADSRHAGNFSLGGVYQSDQTTLILDDKTIDTTGGASEDGFVLKYKDSTKTIGLETPQEIVLVAKSFNNQNPTGLDAPLQIEFGAAQGTVSDPVMIDAAGVLTINETGRYRASLFAQYGRTGAGSTSWLFFRGLRNGIQENVSVLAKLDNSNSDFPMQFELTRILFAGDELTFEVIRDSQGNDSGGLVSEDPTLVDWLESPSAHITIIKE